VYGRVKLTFGTQVIYAYPNGKESWLGFIATDAVAKTGEFPLRVLDTQGVALAGIVIGVDSGNFKKQMISVSKSTAGLEPQAGEMETIQQLKDAATTTRYWNAPLQLRSPVPQCVNSPYGVKRFYNGVFSGNYHKGLDQKSPQGQLIVSGLITGRASVRFTST
jgi:hypothetical protein